jgi:NitT/TauT family transport system substrate-binding protein
MNRRRFLITLGAGLGGVALAACSSSTPATPPTGAPAAAPTTPPAAAASKSTAAPAAASSSLGQASQVMNWFAQPSQGGFWAAHSLGYYTAARIDMDTQQGGPQVSTIPLVAAGKNTFGMAQADQILLSRAEGIPIVAVIAPYQTNPQGFMFHQESGIKDFPDLNGHKIYVAGTATFWSYIKKKYALDKAEQLTYNGQLATWQADKSAVTQCYVISEPFFAKKAGTNPGTLLNADSGFNPYANLMFATEQTIKEKPDLVRAYVQASVKGWKDMLADQAAREKTFAYIKQMNKDQEDDAMANEATTSMPLINTGDATSGGLGIMTQQRWTDLHAQLKEADVLKQDVDVTRAFTTDFLKA